MAKLKDRTGERYGRLVVLKRGPNHICPSGRKVVQWICQCDCGNITTVATTSLGRGLTKSCGCYNLEQQKAVKQNIIHMDYQILDFIVSGEV